MKKLGVCNNKGGVGNLGGDSKISYAQSNGEAITKFSIATSEKWKDK